jgi:hypothetical protein
MAFFSVVVICACPTTVAKFCGLYFRAETMKVSIKWKEGLSFYVKDVEIVERVFGLISLNGFRIYRVIIHFKLKTIQSDINTRQSIPFSPFFANLHLLTPIWGVV